MRNYGLISLMTAAAGMSLASAIRTNFQPAAPGLPHDLGVRRQRVNRKRSRSAPKRHADKRKRRPNMLTISKRVRRKHRRAGK